jgi:hypothetical protein
LLQSILLGSQISFSKVLQIHNVIFAIIPIVRPETGNLNMNFGKDAAPRGYLHTSGVARIQYAASRTFAKSSAITAAAQANCNGCSAIDDRP